MTKLTTQSVPQKRKTDKLYQEIADELMIPIDKVINCIRDGLFSYIKEDVFKELKTMQIRGFGSFYPSNRKMAKHGLIKKEE